MKKKKLFIGTASIALSAIVLSACGSNTLLDAADKTEKVNDSKPTEERVETEFKQQVKEWEDYYSQIDEDIEEKVEEVGREKVGDTINAELVVKDNYTDPIEMAKYTSEMLFTFSNGSLSPKEYVGFLTKYASPNFLESTLTHNDKDDVALMKVIQENIIDSGTKYVSYTFSTPNVVGDKVTFYRKMVTDDGREAFFITTLVKLPDGNLKFESDDNYVPVDF